MVFGFREKDKSARITAFLSWLSLLFNESFFQREEWCFLILYKWKLILMNQLLFFFTANQTQLFMAATAQEAHEIIKQYAEATMTTFVSMRKMKQYGITGNLFGSPSNILFLVAFHLFSIIESPRTILYDSKWVIPCQIIQIL